MHRRKPSNPASQVVNDRAWSARRSVDSRDVGKDLARYAPLPAETGPTWAPDQLSIWPVEGGRYGIDAQYYEATGEQRAGHQVTRLHQAGLDASIRVAGLNDGATLRLGPFDHEAAWLALRAFLGRPMGMPA